MLVITTTEQKVNLNKIRSILTKKYEYIKILKYTTRKMQPQERNGENIYFIDSTTFHNFETRGKFICVHPDSDGEAGIYTKGLCDSGRLVLICNLADIDELKTYCIKNNIPVYMLCVSFGEARRTVQYFGLFDEMNYLYELAETEIDADKLASEINFLYNNWYEHNIK